MKKKPTSKSAFFNSRVLISLAFCLIGVLMALGVAWSASNVAPPAEAKKDTGQFAQFPKTVPVTLSEATQPQQVAAPNVLLALLYDQTDNPGANATVSQDFETANDAFDSQLADDFVVPPGQTWTVQQVVAGGVYFNGAG